jgi:hypothetical protein
MQMAMIGLDGGNKWQMEMESGKLKMESAK